MNGFIATAWNVSGRNPDTKTCEIADAFPIQSSRPLPDEVPTLERLD
jgi:hypothetical protein